MNLILIWIIFILLISSLENLTQFSYFFFNLLMLYITYIFNVRKTLRLTFKRFLLIVNIPLIIFWYLAFVYNDFLSLNPLSREIFMSLFFSYSYLIVYLFLECKNFKIPIFTHFNTTRAYFKLYCV